MKEFAHVLCHETEEIRFVRFEGRVGIGQANCHDFLERIRVGGGWIGHPECSLVWALCLLEESTHLSGKHIDVGSFILLFASFTFSQFI